VLSPSLERPKVSLLGKGSAAESAAISGAGRLMAPGGLQTDGELRTLRGCFEEGRKVVSQKKLDAIDEACHIRGKKLVLAEGPEIDVLGSRGKSPLERLFRSQGAIFVATERGRRRGVTGSFCARGGKVGLVGKRSTRSKAPLRRRSGRWPKRTSTHIERPNSEGTDERRKKAHPGGGGKPLFRPPCEKAVD